MFKVGDKVYWKSQRSPNKARGTIKKIRENVNFGPVYLVKWEDLTYPLEHKGNFLVLALNGIERALKVINEA